MVNSWLPEPSNDNFNELQNSNENVIIMASDLSDDEEQQNHDGYEPLASNENAIEENLSDDDTIEENCCSNINLPPITPIEHTLVKEVWNTPASSEIVMDSDKENEIKMAMANFSLPVSSIPEWAANIPEDQWKQQLMSRIESLNSDKK